VGHAPIAIARNGEDDPFDGIAQLDGLGIIAGLDRDGTREISRPVHAQEHAQAAHR
jgi:hypothetical protein